MGVSLALLSLVVLEQPRYDADVGDGYFYVFSDDVADVYFHTSLLLEQVEGNPEVWTLSVEPDSDGQKLVQTSNLFEFNCAQKRFRVIHTMTAYDGKTTHDSQPTGWSVLPPETPAYLLASYVCPNIAEEVGE